ncbi:MAG: fructose-bisphosphatase class III [Gemmataceae bacterium]
MPNALPARDDAELALLRPLAETFPTVDSAVAEIARLAGALTLPSDTIHVISDIHGEHAKLRHVINNAAGSLRPLVERMFRDRLHASDLQRLVTLILYPRETLESLAPMLSEPGEREAYCRITLAQLVEIINVLARRYTMQRVRTLMPRGYQALFQDILSRPPGPETERFLAAAVEPLVQQGRAWQLIRHTVRFLRNLAISELIIGGDCWDRGPRGDKVVDYIRQQPNVVITWGNHDASWLGACLGQEALIANVLRISLRYRRLFQLEEGYGIPLQPLEQLARTLYADDPAASYLPRRKGIREAVLIARMQKAAALMQFKLEGQVIARHPEWNMDHRRLLHRIDPGGGTITIDGKPRRLKDARFPTLDPARPYDLCAEEQTCLTRIRESFVSSQTLWEHMRFLVGQGSMWLVRDDHLIFHGCVPVDEQGGFLALPIDGRPRAGRDLFDTLERVITRVMDEPKRDDLDMLWYLWCGPLSPFFGKDRIATLEIDLVDDPATHGETKNPYFHLLHEAPFCERILAEFGVDPKRGIIVNGHVPVKIDKGESPLKRSGKAITIDGAFSEAYGDHGYTLVLEPERTFLAKHSHFESVDRAVRDGVDITPEIMEVRRWDRPRTLGDTERGDLIRARIELLQKLVEAYRANRLRQRYV